MLELVEEVVRGLVDRTVHRGGGEQGRGDEDGVGNAAAVAERDVADQGADTEAHREEIEERLEEAREDDHEGMAVDEPAPEGDPACRHSGHDDDGEGRDVDR